MQNNITKFISRTAIVAALYAVLTLTTGFMAYNAVQFRVAEILTLLVFCNKKYFWGLVLGCFISNLFSPLGMVDVVVGTSATVLALLFIIMIRKVLGDNTKSLFIASLGPVIFNAILVGIELTILFKEMPFYLNAFYVALGELTVVTIVGVLIFPKLRSVVEKHDF